MEDIQEPSGTCTDLAGETHTMYKWSRKREGSVGKERKVVLAAAFGHGPRDDAWSEKRDEALARVVDKHGAPKLPLTESMHGVYAAALDTGKDFSEEAVVERWALIEKGVRRQRSLARGACRQRIRKDLKMRQLEQGLWLHGQQGSDEDRPASMMQERLRTMDGTGVRADLVRALELGTPAGGGGGRMVKATEFPSSPKGLITTLRVGDAPNEVSHAVLRLVRLTYPGHRSFHKPWTRPFRRARRKTSTRQTVVFSILSTPLTGLASIGPPENCSILLTYVHPSAMQFVMRLNRVKDLKGELRARNPNLDIGGLFPNASRLAQYAEHLLLRPSLALVVAVNAAPDGKQGGGSSNRRSARKKTKRHHDFEEEDSIIALTLEDTAAPPKSRKKGRRRPAGPSISGLHPSASSSMEQDGMVDQVAERLAKRLQQQQQQGAVQMRQDLFMNYAMVRPNTNSPSLLSRLLALTLLIVVLLQELNGSLAKLAQSQGDKDGAKHHARAVGIIAAAAASNVPMAAPPNSFGAPTESTQGTVSLGPPGYGAPGHSTAPGPVYGAPPGYGAAPAGHVYGAPPGFGHHASAPPGHRYGYGGPPAYGAAVYGAAYPAIAPHPRYHT